MRCYLVFVVCLCLLVGFCCLMFVDRRRSLLFVVCLLVGVCCLVLVLCVLFVVRWCCCCLLMYVNVVCVVVCCLCCVVGCLFVVVRCYVSMYVVR